MNQKELIGSRRQSLTPAPGLPTQDAWSVDLSGLTYRGTPAGASSKWWLILLRGHTPGQGRVKVIE
jgi:hypothetical protein